MKYLALGTQTTWLRVGKDIGGACLVLKWSGLWVICGLILQLDRSQICRPLEMHLIVTWQLAECNLCVERVLLNINWHTADMCQQTHYQNKVLPDICLILTWPKSNTSTKDLRFNCSAPCSGALWHDGTECCSRWGSSCSSLFPPPEGNVDTWAGSTAVPLTSVLTYWCQSNSSCHHGNVLIIGW